MISHTSAEKENQRQLALAKEAVERKLDELKGQSWTTIIATFNSTGRIASQDFPVEGLNYYLNPTFSNKGQGTCSRLFNQDPDLLEIEVLVEWEGVFGGASFDSIQKAKSVGKRNTYAMRTMITR
jgi:hypothetical protein